MEKHRENVCPFCDFEGLQYPDGTVIQDSVATSDWVCPDCGRAGTEVFDLVFRSHSIVRDED